MFNNRHQKKGTDNKTSSVNNHSENQPHLPDSVEDVSALSRQRIQSKLSPDDILQLQRTIGNDAVINLLVQQKLQRKRWVVLDDQLVNPDNPDELYVGSDAPKGLREGDVWNDETHEVSHASDRLNAIFSGESTAGPELNLPSQEEFDAKLRNLGRKDSKTEQPETPAEKPEPKEMSYEWLMERGLSQGEISALQQYTTALYHLANKFLRKQIEDLFVFDQIGRFMEGTSVDDDIFNDLVATAGYEYSRAKVEQWKLVFQRYLQLIVSGMEKLPVPSPTTVSRGVNLETQPEFFAKHKQDEIITDPGFMSTAFGTPFAKDSIIVIQLPPKHPGRDISKLSAFEQESEILFPPGTGYKVVQTLTRKDGEFDVILNNLVSDKTDLDNRFKQVNRIIKTELSLPKL